MGRNGAGTEHDAMSSCVSAGSLPYAEAFRVVSRTYGRSRRLGRSGRAGEREAEVAPQHFAHERRRVWMGHGSAGPGYTGVSCSVDRNGAVVSTNRDDGIHVDRFMPNR